MSNCKNDMGRIWKAGGEGEGKVKGKGFLLYTTKETVATFVFLARRCFELDV